MFDIIHPASTNSNKFKELASIDDKINKIVVSSSNNIPGTKDLIMVKYDKSLHNFSFFDNKNLFDISNSGTLIHNLFSDLNSDESFKRYQFFKLRTNF